MPTCVWVVGESGVGCSNCGGLLAMQENTQGFDRGISIWGRHIHHCSSMDGVSFWNGNPSPSCFFLMHILHLSCFRMRCIEFAQIRVMGVCASAGILQELNNYLSVSTMTSVVVDRSRDGEYLRIDFNLRYLYLRFLHQCVVFCTSASLAFHLWVIIGKNNKCSCKLRGTNAQ